MQRKTLFTLCAAAVVATSALGLATAKPAKPASLMASMTWKGTTSRDWNVDSNWTGGSAPAAGDIVTIPATLPGGTFGDPIVSNADGLAGDLTIASPRTVTVTGKTLTLNSAVTHDFDGDLFLTDGSSILKFVDNDATVDGDGAIIGQHNGAKIQIEGGDKLTSTMLIHGRLTMETNGGSGDGTFVNGSTGIVWANAGGILLMDGSLTLDDVADGDARALWKANAGSSTVLQFESGLAFVNSNPELAGDFVLCGDAKIDFDVQVRTSGCFDETTANGWILGSGTDYFKDGSTSCGGIVEGYSTNDVEFTNSCS